MSTDRKIANKRTNFIIFFNVSKLQSFLLSRIIFLIIKKQNKQKNPPQTTVGSLSSCPFSFIFFPANHGQTPVMTAQGIPQTKGRLIGFEALTLQVTKLSSALVCSDWKLLSCSSYLKFLVVSFQFSADPVFTEDSRSVPLKMSCGISPAFNCQARWEQLSPRFLVISAWSTKIFQKATDACV